MFAKVEVNGDGVCDLYRILREAQPGDGSTSDITWNFEKFLVGRDGEVLGRYSPMVTPEELVDVVAAHL